MDSVLFDTSVYISALRLEEEALINLRRIAPNTAVWLSSVVLEELYAGAAPRDSRIIARLERDFEKARRILVPNLSDWTLTGRVLARLAAEYDYERTGQVRLTNDALLAMSAARNGIKVITANERDFATLARIRPFRWQVGLPTS